MAFNLNRKTIFDIHSKYLSILMMKDDIEQRK